MKKADVGYTVAATPHTAGKGAGSALEAARKIMESAGLDDVAAIYGSDLGSEQLDDLLEKIAKSVDAVSNAKFEVIKVQVMHPANFKNSLKALEKDSQR